MRFCEFCGTKLEGGMICACNESKANLVNATAPPPPMGMAAPPPPPMGMAAPPPPPMGMAAPPPPPMGMAAPPPPPPPPVMAAAPPPPPPPPPMVVAPPPSPPMTATAPPPPPPMAVAPPPPPPMAAAPPPPPPTVAATPPPPMAGAVPPPPPGQQFQQPQYQQPYGQQPYVQTAVVQPAVNLIKMCPNCNSPAPKNSGQFCTTCGGAYQMVMPPTFENGGVCPNQNCRMQVPPGSAKFCTHCGRSFNSSLGIGGAGNFGIGGAGSINMGNVNLGAVGDMAGKLGMSMQRMIMGGVAILGIIVCLLPWYKLDDQLKMLMAYKADGNPLETVSTIAKVVSIIVFAGVIALCVLIDRQGPLSSRGKKFPILISVAGVIALLISGFCLFALNSNKNDSMGMMSVGIWIYLALLMVIAVIVIPHIKKLE